MAKARAVLRNWPPFVREVIRHNPRQAPSILLKSAFAQVMWRFEPERTLASGLHKRPFGAGRDYMKWHGELETGLELINWQKGGHTLVEDKVITAERFVRSGIATAPIIAVIGRDTIAHPHGGIFPMVDGIEEVARALDTAPDELIVKPAGAARGVGISGPTRAEDKWSLDDRLLTSRELAAKLISDRTSNGLLIQPRLKTHSAMAPVGGELGLSTARIITALLNSGPVVIAAHFKLMGSKGLVDNFSGGAYGNMRAWIDGKTGTLTGAHRRGPGRKFLMDEVTHHPATDAPIEGFKIPLWDEAIALSLRAATACPESPLLGMDVAITDDGPVIIEINAAWDAKGTQLITGRGLRSTLREIWPNLAAEPGVKACAPMIMGL